MKTLTLENRHPKNHPAWKAGTTEWCLELKRNVLHRALDGLEKNGMNLSEVVAALKIRKALLASLPRQKRTIWIDPEEWGQND